MAGRVGYEHRYRFWMENEIVRLYAVRLYAGGFKSFLFEVRTNFIVKRRPGEGGGDETLDSETMDACVKENQWIGPDLYFRERLREYWISDDEIKRKLREAFDFATQLAADPQHASRRVIPVVVGIDVCTVQQEGEPFASTVDRAIRARDLIPLYMSNIQKQWQLKPKMDPVLIINLIQLPRTRVQSVDEGLALMQTCRLCSRSPTVGAQITSLPCGHAFHSGCVVKHLETNYLCPECDSPAHHLPYLR